MSAAWRDVAFTNGYEFTQGKGYELPEYPFVEPPELKSGEVRRHKVVIVGAGITGLTLACCLAKLGVKAVLLDEDDTVGVKGASSRGICYTQKSLEIFQRLGVYERIAAKGIQWSVGRTFAGKDEVYSFDLRQNSGYSLSAQPPFINIQQFYIEGYLVERIYGLGHVDLRWKSRVTGFQQHAGYATLTAHSGQEALRCAAERAPTLVMLDVMMPGMDGFETCERLHKLPGLADVPVIFLTGAAQRPAIAKAFSTGGVDYVTKPFVLEELLARVKTHVDLKRARDRLGVMLREREEITDVVAHDLKNPLTCVLFSAQLLRRRGDNAERREELVTEIEDSARSALEFIQRFLTRGAEGQRLRQFTARRVDLHELARQAARTQCAAAESGEVAVTVQGDSAEANVDPVMTRNVLQNLLANAIQYSPRGSTIEIDVARLPTGFAQCRVMDRGPGIAPADQAKLFTRFLSLASASERAEFSSGLGLAIAKHDVALMGGHLWYQSRDGGGSIFGLDLPAP